MTIRVRKDLFDVTTGIHTHKIHPTSRLLTQITGIHPQPNKAIVGKNAFAHEAGIHQHGVINDRRTYEIMTPEMVGQAGTELVLGKHSGKHGLKARYEALGYHLSPEELRRVSKDFKELADRKKTVLDEDLISILHHEVMEDVREVHQLVSLDVHCGGDVSSATVTIESDGETRKGEGTGDGPIAAAFVALDSVLDTHIVLERFSIRAATPGRDALGEVSIQASIDGHTFTGRGAHTDVVRASAEAFLHAINKAAAARSLEGERVAATSEIGGA